MRAFAPTTCSSGRPAVQVLAGRPRRRRRFSGEVETSLGLQVPIGQQATTVVRWCAAGLTAAGLAVFLTSPAGSWENLAAAVAADLGGTLWLLMWIGVTAEVALVVNPVTALLAFYAMRRFVGFLYVLEQGAHLESPFGAVPTLAYIESSAKAEWITLAGTVAFCLGWLLARRPPGASNNKIGSSRWCNGQLWLAYALGVTAILGDWIFPSALQGFGALVRETKGLAYGAVFVLLWTSREFGIGGRAAYFSYAAVVPLLVRAMSWGMKSEFFFVLAPIGLAHSLRSRTRGLASVLLMTLLLLGFVYPYVQTYRQANWGSGAGASADDVSREVRDRTSEEGVTATMRDSWSEFQLRIGSVNEAGAVVYFADRTGFVGNLFLQNLVYGLVPRFVWPGKPKWDPAGWFTGILTGTDSNESGGSSTALHIAPELYWMYGWPGTLFGLLLLGAFYRKVSDTLLNAGYSTPVYWAVWYAFLVYTAFLEEWRYNMAVLTPLIILCNAYAVVWLIKTISPQPRSLRRNKCRPGTTEVPAAP